MNPANPNNVREVKTVPIPTDLLCVARVPGSARLWIGGADSNIYDIDLDEAQPRPRVLKGQTSQGHSSYVSGVVLTDRHLISGSWDKRLLWWDLETRRQVRAVQAHQRWIRQLALTPDGRTLVSISDDMVCRLWDAATGQLLHELRGHAEQTPHLFPSKLYACAISSDGRYAATGDALGHIVVWDLATAQQAAAFDAPIFYVWDFDRNNHAYGGLRSLAFSPDGTHLALGGLKNTDVAIIHGDSRVHVHNWRTSELTHEFKVGGNFQYESMYFSHRGDWLVGLAGGGGGGKVVFFDMEAKRVLKEARCPTQIFGLAANENSDTLYGVGRNQIVEWELKG